MGQDVHPGAGKDCSWPGLSPWSCAQAGVPQGLGGDHEQGSCVTLEGQGVGLTSLEANVLASSLAAWQGHTEPCQWCMQEGVDRLRLPEGETGS